jgi:ubiquinone biosynthesis protein
MTTEPTPDRIRVPDASAMARSYRQTVRLKDVLAILVRNGFEDVVEGLRGRRDRQRTKRKGELPVRERGEPRSHQTRAERIRSAIEELGPTFVKFGQVLSTRSDLVPPDLLVELAKLQDRVPPFPFEQVREIVEAELGAPLEEIFDSFDPDVLASASLGQVHRARLDGDEVAVKVQRPGILETIEADIALMMHLAALLERRVEGWDVHQPTRAVKEFRDTIREELDYEIEAAHQERFLRRYRDDPTAHVPRVFRDATTSRVLTMEYIQGIKVSELQHLREAGANLEEVARRGFSLVIQQTLVDGFFHADPHPGNLFVLPGDVICFLDFGMVGRLGREVRDDFVELLYHIVDRDPAQVTEIVLRLTSPDDVHAPELERDVARFLDAYVDRPLGELNLSHLLREVLEALARHRLRLPPDLFLMLKALTQIEAVAVSLVPEFDLVKEGEAYIRRIFLERYRPRRMAEEAAQMSREFYGLLRDAPSAVREFARLVRGGGLRVGLQQEHMPEMLRAGDRIANRIAFAFVLGAALVGSAIVAAAEIPPLWRGISVLGLGGFVVALVMAAWLLISILRHGRF